ncbi:hypothetical protein WK13_07605 [Burkholderia ubonensis]|uniref:hypothetical protein n=1 Tax=Burkholderia ubonensis TaxID=101571 RepID=UPI00075CA3E8|nr:hypothetical protein [Burkholderia ubonensis]KVR18338.1 hypothetical protein WK13_07605 [Burkholderia ubonensis]
MSNISGVIHHALPNHTRVLTQEKLLEFLQIQMFDQLLAHQYCVRRLSLHYPDAFCALQAIRTQIEAVLAETPLNNEDRLFIGRRITATARCMRVLDSRQARAIGAAGEKAAFQRLLEHEIEPDPKEISFPILCHLSDAQVERLSNILGDSCAVVDKIQDELNFLDYYDPFALTNLVSGKSMLTHYLAAKHGVYSVHPWAEPLGRDNYWLHTREAELDEGLTGVVCEHAFLAKRPTSNVRIFGHDQHRISINGIELKNHLILAVPTDRAPTHIDATLRDFRDALKQAFIDMCGCYANVSSPEFDNSLFMRNFDERVFLIHETKQYRSRLYGLWMWDLVNPGESGSGLTVPQAIDKMIPEAEEQLKKFAPDDTPYDFSSYKNHYDLAVRQIMPKPAKRTTLSKARELDRYLTFDMTILGRRPSAATADTPVPGAPASHTKP